MKHLLSFLLFLSTFSFTLAQSNHSLSFDGDGDYVLIEDASSNIVNSDASLIGWFKINEFDALNPLIGFRNYPNDNCSMYAVMGSNGTIETLVNGNLQSFIQADYNSNQWYHIALIFDGETFKTYLDGELAASINTPSSIFNCSDTDLIFGGMQIGNFEDLNGGVDDVSLWSLALTEDQIQAHLNTPLSGDESGLVGYWDFNDGEGSTLTDLSGNGNDGTIYGATWSDDGAPVQPLEELDTIATITLSDVDTYIFPGYFGDTALVAVNADLGELDIYSFEIHFNGVGGFFDEIVTNGTVLDNEDWNIITNTENLGELQMSLVAYGSTPVSGQETLFYLKFHIMDFVNVETLYPIEISYVELNELEGIILTSNGSITSYPLLFGDVTMNNDVSGMDAADILRYLVGSVDFDKYQMSAADVTMDESISALDASVVAQNAVGLVESLPHSEGTDGQGFLTINEGLEYQPGAILEVPVMLTGGNNLLSFEVDLTYNPNQVTVEGIDWSDQIDHFMIEENNEPGSIKVAGSGTTPDGQEGVFATIRLQVLETTTEESINLTINKIRINESAPVEDVMVFITQEVLSTDNATVPNVYALHQNYPNPFNPNTKISYDLPEASVVSLSIYDLMGREIRTMINSEQIAGFKNIQWNATDNLGKSVPAGMYIYTIQAGEFRQTRKMVLLK